MDVLLNHGADVNASLRGDSPLHLAAARGDSATVERLIMAKPKILTNLKGQTPVEVAEANGFVSLALRIQKYATAVEKEQAQEWKQVVEDIQGLEAPFHRVLHLMILLSQRRRNNKAVQTNTGLTLT